MGMTRGRSASLSRSSWPDPSGPGLCRLQSLLYKAGEIQIGTAKLQYLMRLISRAALVEKAFVAQEQVLVKQEVRVVVHILMVFYLN